jgi:hypothetical protein
MSCSQTRFFALLEKVLDPMARRDAEQNELAEALTRALKRDGFVVQQVAAQSGYPIFGVARAQAGVAGAMKNIIFASIGEKPELVFRDTVNNDVQIVRNADKVLGYEVYRFGAAEFADVDFERSMIGPNAQAVLAKFFDKLLRKHQVI